jgi:hypothetical protein
MLVTVVHQEYRSNVACDTSGYCNHGLPLNVTPTLPGFRYAAANSRINIRPSPSLTQFGCIRGAVSFTLQPTGAPQRHNLMEGFESFALFVNPDLSISGTIFDASSNWTGATSKPATVSTGKPHLAIIECDGINMVRLTLDGTVVGENYAVAGTVRDIGAYGLTVGHWPNPQDQYAFQGEIFGVLLQKYDPTKDLMRMLDPCCFDREGIGTWLREMQGKGVTTAKLVAASLALQAVCRKVAAAARGNDKARTTVQQNLGSALIAAIANRDGSTMESIMQQWQTSAAGQISAAAQAQFEQDLRAALAGFGFETADWCRLMKLLCLNLCAFASKKGGQR